jgi:hypothetical protein
MPTGGNQVGDSSPVLKTSLYACDKAGVFTEQRLKQTENYKVHKRIFHTAELCKLFTLEFLFFEFIILRQHLVWKAREAELKMCVVITWSFWE